MSEAFEKKTNLFFINYLNIDKYTSFNDAFR